MLESKYNSQRKVIKEQESATKQSEEEGMADQLKPQIRPISNIVIVVGNLRATVCYVFLTFFFYGVNVNE